MGYVAQIKRIEGETYEGETVGECIARGSAYTFMIDERCEGGAFDDEDHNHWQPHRVDRETILKGITIVQERFPHIWARYVADAADAGDNDAVFQCAIFRNIIFGLGEKKVKKISVILTDEENEMLTKIMVANKMTVSDAVKDAKLKKHQVKKPSSSTLKI